MASNNSGINIPDEDPAAASSIITGASITGSIIPPAEAVEAAAINTAARTVFFIFFS
jgi:hypothetical protein